MKTYIALFCCAILVICSAMATAEEPCAPVADSMRIDEARLNYLKSFTEKEKNSVVVLPFHDIHGYEPEPVLPYGIPFAVYDMFSDANPVIHPYYSQAVVYGLGLGGDSLAQVSGARLAAEKLSAGIVVFGAIQRATPTQVRVIIYAYNARKNAVTSPAVQFATEINDSFFKLLRTHVVKAVKQAGGSLRETTYRDPAMASFRYYVRGTQLTERYDMMSLDLAIPWFEKALKENYQNYDDAALGLARAHLMQALLTRLNKSDYSQSMIMARRALQFVREKKNTTRYHLTYRFLDGHTAFANAVSALKLGQMPLAMSEAIKAVAVTPEDGLAEQIYWTALGAIGKGKARIARFNPVCF